MFAWNTGTRIAFALLVPFWWGMGLMVLAVLGDVSPRWGRRVSHLFDRLDRTRGESPKSTASQKQFAA
jgi:hypothetical protein